MTATGHDGDGAEYSSIDALWEAHEEDLSGWYDKAMEYWSSQDASINGVLGGFGDLHPVDLAGSELFLNQVSQLRGGLGVLGVDCGAGVGRITQFLLAKKITGPIDIVEPCEKLIKQAQIELPKTLRPNQIGEFIHMPLQKWDPSASIKKYDLLWHQWVLLYLTDADCVAYLERCKRSLSGSGVICVKENVALKGQFLVDKDDNSVTRTLDQYKALFKTAGLQIVCQLQQPRWPSHLFPVLMWALAPL